MYMIHNLCPRWDESLHCSLLRSTQSPPFPIPQTKSPLQCLLDQRILSLILFHIQKSLKRRSSLALASGTLIQSVSAYSSKFRVSPENPNFGTIGGFRSFDRTPSQSIVLKKLKGRWWHSITFLVQNVLIVIIMISSFSRLFSPVFFHILSTVPQVAQSFVSILRKKPRHQRCHHHHHHCRR